MATRTKERRIQFPFDTEAIELIDGPPEKILTIKDFRPYQTWMSDKIFTLPFVFLAAEMGLGKTGACLWALVRLLHTGAVQHPLIVAPLNVAENTWPEEIATWAFSRHLTYRVVTGTEDQRIAALEYPAQITIVNRENVKWLERYWGARKFPYDMLIYDEASRLKGGDKKTKPTKRKDGSFSEPLISEFGVLSMLRFKFKKIVELSGTPAPNGLIDLWGPIFIGDRGKRLGTSITAYRDRWFRYDMYLRKYDPFDHSEEQIMGAIKDVFFSLKEEDYLKLPPLNIVDHRVDLPPKAMQLYKRFEKESVIEELDIEAVNGGVLTNKLLQVANGSVYHEDGTATHLHDAKLDKLESILAEAMGRPVLCAYSFQFDMERIKKRFPYVRVFGEGADDTRDWNRGRIKFMLTHPASAGHGLNFQHGGNIAVWYGLTWSLELYRQFVKRLHRSGQKEAFVMLHRIIANGTVDENVVKLLSWKGATQDRITDAVRVRLETIRQQQEMFRMAA